MLKINNMKISEYTYEVSERVFIEKLFKKVISIGEEVIGRKLFKKGGKQKYPKP